MQRIGFDREKYIALQSEHIEARREQFGGKLYLEFGGKLFDDMHASRVLPGFTPDNKIGMLEKVADEVEIVALADGARPGLDAPFALGFVRAVGSKSRAKVGWTDVARFSAPNRSIKRCCAASQAGKAAARRSRPASVNCTMRLRWSSPSTNRTSPSPSSTRRLRPRVLRSRPMASARVEILG